MLGAGHVFFKRCFQKYIETDVAGSGPFQTQFSRFGLRAWRWLFPIQVCLQKCTETNLRAWFPSKLNFRGLARVLGAGHFLFKVCLQKNTGTDLAGLGRPSKAPISSFGSRDWRWSFPLQICLHKYTETDLAGLGPSQTVFFEIWLA